MSLRNEGTRKIQQPTSRLRQRLRVVQLLGSWSAACRCPDLFGSAAGLAHSLDGLMYLCDCDPRLSYAVSRGFTQVECGLDWCHVLCTPLTSVTLRRVGYHAWSET
jgi:hypothetical protein